MKYSALIGYPTRHSVSHLLYAELIKTVKIEDFYQHIRVDVQLHEFEQSLNAFRTLNFIGLSVTLPLKLEALRHLDKVDPVASELGAVNTIKLGDTTTGYNTDWIGIVESIKAFGNRTDYETATIFGTGGAAHAAIYACKQLGVQNINVVYRHNLSQATRGLLESSERLGINMHEYNQVHGLIKRSQLIINATSAGMVHNDRLPFELKLIKDLLLTNKVFLDAVFNPINTPLLGHFKAQGACTVDGLWMMVFQGVKALSIWLDSPVPTKTSELKRIHSLLKAELSNV